MVRPRPDGNDAYKPASYSELLASWEDEPTVTKEVLLGLRLGIVMPEGDYDPEALDRCNNLAAIASPIPPVELARGEIEVYLTEQQKVDLDKGSPILFHSLVHRQRVVAHGSPRLTDRLNRLADARQFMIAQALHHLGHLIEKRALKSSRKAFELSANRIIDDWWPHGLIRRDDPDTPLYDRLSTTFDAGNHAPVYGKFLPPGTKAIKQIIDEYRVFSFTHDAIAKRTTYWLTVLRAGLLIEAISKDQLSAHNRLSATPESEDYGHTDIMDFIGGNKRRPSLDDLLPVAYYGVPDLGYVVPWTSSLHKVYECAAAIGEIARGKRAQITKRQAALLLTAFDETQHPDPSVSVGPDRYLTGFAFLRAAMTNTRAKNWWQSVLTAAHVDNYGVRHIALSDQPGVAGTEFLDQPEFPNTPHQFTPLTIEMLQVAAFMKFPPILLFQRHPASNDRLFGQLPTGEMWIDQEQHLRFGADAAAWLEDSVALCLCQLAIEQREGRNLHLDVATSPYCIADHIALAVAAEEVIYRSGEAPLPHFELDIRAYSRLVSDTEAMDAAVRGRKAVAAMLSRLEVAQTHLERTTPQG